jgi:hypothetical protein
VEQQFLHHPHTYLEVEIFLMKLRKYSDSVQRGRNGANRGAPRSAGLYALVVELLTMYAQQRLSTAQLLTGLRGALKGHRQVAGAVSALLRSIHASVNEVRIAFDATCVLMVLCIVCGPAVTSGHS